MSEVMRETAGSTQSNLTLEMSTLAFTMLFLCNGGPSFLCGVDKRRFRHNLKEFSGFTQIDSNRCLDISA